MNDNRLTTRRTRRQLLNGTMAIMATMAAPMPAWATNTKDAVLVVEKMANYLDESVVRVKDTRAAQKAFEEAFRQFADIKFLGAYALGAAGRGVSTTKKAKFSDAFVGYLSRKYARRFTAFTGPKIKVGNATQSRNYVAVKATASVASGQTVNLEFHVSDKSGTPKVINIFIEGVNVLLAERSEILALLSANGGSIDALTKDIRSR